MNEARMMDPEGAAPPRAPAAPRAVRFGLSGRIVAFIVFFVTLAEIAIYVPSIANFRDNWLRDRLSAASTAALVFEASPVDMAPPDLTTAILASVGAKTIVLKTADTRRLLAVSDMPRGIDESVDVRSQTAMASILAAYRALTAPNGRILQVVGPAPMGAEFMEITLDETPLRKAMIAYSINVLLLSLIVSGFGAALAMLALHLTVLRPVRRLTSSITAFGADPENATLIISPSGRRHEIGVAEDALALMQTSLVRELAQAKHLAALGLAVAKINHDLRNILASAQLLSDRLAERADPLGRSLAPRLVATLDRAIAYCQSTLTYGKASERAPQVSRVRLQALANDAAEVAFPPDGARIVFLNEAPADIEVWADPEQVFRILLNLMRNALDAFAGAGPRPGQEPAVRLRAAIEGESVVALLDDSGPGVPARAREKLFEAFQGSARAGGVGLGLAIAADLSHANGGAIALADAPADGLGGASFRLTLPRAKAAPRASVRAFRRIEGRRR